MAKKKTPQADFSNVETLSARGRSTCELAIDLHKWAQKKDIVDAVVITRGPDGALGIIYTPMSSADITEMATYLNAHSHQMVWNENEAPVLEEDETWDED